MRNKILLGFSFVLMVFVLAGCISIPIGDSSLEISTDGIEFVPASGEDGNNNEDNDSIFDMFGNDNDNNDMNANNDNDFNETNNNDNANDLDTDMMGQGGPGLGTCTEPMDHSTFFKHVDYDIWVPECAALDDRINLKSDYVSGDFEIEQADWEALMDAYADEFNMNPEGDYSNKTSDMWTELSNGADLRIQIWQKEEENRTDLRLTYYYPKD